MVADVLLHYGVDGVSEATASARYNLGDSNIRLCMSGYLWLPSTWTSMSVLQLSLRHFHDNCHLLCFLVASVEPFMVILVSMHILYILFINVVRVVISSPKYPRCVETR